MAQHQLDETAFIDEGDSVGFTCLNCGTICNFNKPGVGTPAARVGGAGFLPAEEFYAIIHECTG